MSSDYDGKPMLIKWFRKEGQIDLKLIDGTSFDSCKMLAVSGGEYVKSEVWTRNVGSDYETHETIEGKLLWESGSIDLWL